MEVGLENHADWPDEIMGYVKVLTGELPSPIDHGVANLMEVSNAYLSRATEMEIHILAGERKGIVAKGSTLYRFRTGELRSFIELCVKSQEAGSRRITMAINEDQQKYR